MVFPPASACLIDPGATSATFATRTNAISLILTLFVRKSRGVYLYHSAGQNAFTFPASLRPGSASPASSSTLPASDAAVNPGFAHRGRSARVVGAFPLLAG